LRVGAILTHSSASSLFSPSLTLPASTAYNRFKAGSQERAQDSPTPRCRLQPPVGDAGSPVFLPVVLLSRKFTNNNRQSKENIMSSLDVAAVQQQVAAQREAIIEFLRELVAIPSMDSQIKLVGERAQVEMEKLGFMDIRFDSMGN